MVLDGYYWPCPYNYTPTGEHCLYRCPASYLVKSFANAALAFRAAEDLATAMLDVLLAAKRQWMEQNGVTDYKKSRSGGENVVY